MTPKSSNKSKQATRTVFVPFGAFEKKSITVLNGSSYNNTGLIQQLSQIDAGTGRDNRIGNRITLTRIRMRGSSSVNAAGVQSQTARIVIFCDKQQVDNNIPGVSGAGGLLDTASSLADYSLDQPDRFHVVFDKLYCLNKVDNTTPAIDIDVKLPKTLTTQFSSNLGTSIAKNGWYALWIGDVAANASSFNVNTRVFWTDY